MNKLSKKQKTGWTVEDRAKGKRTVRKLRKRKTVRRSMRERETNDLNTSRKMKNGWIQRAPERKMNGVKTVRRSRSERRIRGVNKLSKKQKTGWAVAVAAIVVLLAVGGGVGYAVWKNTLRAQDVTDVPAADWNESAVYQVFALLGADGAPLLSAPQNASEAAALAFVGYTGLETELRVPESAPVELAGTRVWKPVTKALVLPQDGGGAVLFRNGEPYSYPGQSIGLRGNAFVTELTLPKSVVSVASGAFASMRELRKLTLSGTEGIRLGDAAFSDCPKLAALTSVRPLIDTDFEAAFAGTPLV